MKILIIGNPTSIYTKYYVQKVLAPLEARIYLNCNQELDSADVTFYKHANVEFVNLYKTSGILKKIPRISTIRAYIKNLKDLAGKEKFDYIQIHSIGNPGLMRFAYKALKKNTNCLILTFWGSDILNIDNKRAKQIKNLIKVADKIVLSTKTMKERFRFYYGDSYDHKIKSRLFGNSIIEHNVYLKENSIKLTSDNKRKSEKYIVAIGYNGSKRQQHLNVINELGKLDEINKAKLHLIIQMSYGSPDGLYKNEIMAAMKTASLEGEIIEKYLTMDETIRLRKSVDLFINGQITDALSSSVLEYMYFGAEVLNPNWISYEEWRDLGIIYNEYDKFEDIASYVIELLEGRTYTPHENNVKIIEENFTWNSVAPTWRKLFE